MRARKHRPKEFAKLPPGIDPKASLFGRVHTTEKAAADARAALRDLSHRAQLDPNDYATPSGEFSAETPAKQQEEFTACIGTALLSVRLGLYPCCRSKA